VLIFNITREEYDVGSHYETYKVSYGGDVKCPVPFCETKIHVSLVDIELSQEREDVLLSYLKGCGPWICEGCGTAFGLSQSAQQKVLSVYQVSKTYKANKSS